MNDCDICMTSPKHPDKKCCFNCSRDGSTCETGHSCGLDCPTWEAMSNSKRIRTMSDEQLSALLCSTDWRLSEQKECLEWLKQPVDDFIK